MADFYGTIVDANLYFAQRLHTIDWDISTVADRQASLVQAAELIDQFDYLGQKYAVQQVLDSNPDCNIEASNIRITLQEAELSQTLEFPRGSSENVPTEIEQAGYLIAKALLSGRDPDADLEGMEVTSTSYGSVKTSYDRSGNDQEHIYHLIPSPEAFSLIRPFFRSRDAFDIKKVS